MARTVKAVTALKDIFGTGNSKLGKVLTFSIPAVKTCPQATELCKSRCYATKGYYCMPAVQNSLNRNWRNSLTTWFTKTAIDLLAKVKNYKYFRIHPSGDFYSPKYAYKWYDIIKASPHIKFWVYTRSWRDPKFTPIFKKMARLPNLHMWFSCDAETGKPLVVPKRVRLAYMMVNDSDVPKYSPDLYFRDYPIRGNVRKHINNTIVCPPENGASPGVHCDKCRICLSDDNTHRTRNRFTTVSTIMPRIPLTLVS